MLVLLKRLALETNSEAQLKWTWQPDTAHNVALENTGEIEFEGNENDSRELNEYSLLVMTDNGFCKNKKYLFRVYVESAF